MKYRMAIQARADSQRRLADMGAAPDNPNVSGRTIEDLSGTSLRVTVNGFNRGLALAIALSGAIVGWGFLSHDSVVTRPSAHAGVLETRIAQARDDARRSSGDPASDSPIRVTSPRPGDRLLTDVVVVRGIATRPVARLHLSVTLGAAVLGWTNVALATPGEFRARIPVFASNFDAPVVLHASAIEQHVGLPPWHEDIPLSIRNPSPVGLWNAAVGPRSTGCLLLDGYASSSIDRVVLVLVNERGIEVGRGFVDPAVDDMWPGSVGGGALGIVSFHIRLAIDGERRLRGLIVRLASTGRINPHSHDVSLSSLALRRIDLPPGFCANVS